MAYIKLNKNAFFHNLQIITKKAGAKENIAVVLKDNAYGHGLMQIAALAKEFGLTRAVVRNRNEAKKIQDLFDYILILSDIPQKSVNFSFAVNDLQALKKFPSHSNIELKIDTGMHRNGLQIEELKQAFAIIKKRNLDLQGVFTHFRSADELSSELFWQEKNFNEAKNVIYRLCKEYGFQAPYFHSCNSAALFRFNRLKDDFARVGIAAYGYLEIDNLFEYPDLKPVLSLWAKKNSTRVLQKGERIGYGGVFEADKDMVVSNYDVGYADGIFRSLQSIKDRAILGRVSMDSISVEGEDEEICVFDDAKKVARSLGTISYEVLVKLNPYLERIVC